MISKISSYTGNVAKKVFSNKIFYKGADDKSTLAAGISFAAGVTLASILLKDVVGCIYYVKQTLNNKEIPEEKRKFVAALDLTNGFMYIITQIAAYYALSTEKSKEWMFNKVFGDQFSPEKQKIMLEKAEKSLISYGEVPNKELLEKGLEAARKSGKNALGALVSLVGATVVAKRMVVPLFATPLAEWAKDNIIDKGDKKAQEQKNIDEKHDADALNDILKERGVVKKRVMNA